MGCKVSFQSTVCNKEFASSFLLGMITAVRGEHTETIYELMGMDEGKNAEIKQFCTINNQAYKLFCERQWQEAMDMWKTVPMAYSEDQTVVEYIIRCEKYIEKFQINMVRQ